MFGFIKPFGKPDTIFPSCNGTYLFFDKPHYAYFYNYYYEKFKVKYGFIDNSGKRMYYQR